MVAVAFDSDGILTAGAFEWGPGSTIYVPSGYTAELVAATFSSDTNTSGTIDVYITGAEQNQTLSVSGLTRASKTYTGIGINNGAVLRFRTELVTSSTSDQNRVTAFIQFTPE